MARLCLFGAYDPDAPRLKRLLAGWTALGGRVVECPAPMWPGAGERAALPGSGGLAAMPGRWLAAQARLWRQREAVRGADVVLVAYPGHLDMPMARALARRYGKPLLFDPFLSLWDTAVGDRGLYAAGSVRARAVKAIDRLALRLADGVLADTGAMADFYAELADLPRERMHVVPVGAEEGLFTPPAPNVRQAESGCEVLFYGRMIPLHGVETIVQAARWLEGEPAIAFHLVGEGQVDVAGLLAAGPANVRWTRALPYAALPDAIAGATLTLGLFGSSAKAARVVPHKVYEAAAMGRAIVTADTPAMREAFPEAVALVPPGDPEALAATIRALCADADRRERLGTAARARFEAAFSTRAIGEALRAAVAALGVRA